MRFASFLNLYSVPEGSAKWERAAFSGGSAVKNSPANAGDEMQVPSLGWEDPLEEGMTTIPVFLPGESPWTEEPGRLHGVAKSRTQMSNQAQHC